MIEDIVVIPLNLAVYIIGLLVLLPFAYGVSFIISIFYLLECKKLRKILNEKPNRICKGGKTKNGKK